MKKNKTKKGNYRIAIEFTPLCLKGRKKETHSCLLGTKGVLKIASQEALELLKEDLVVNLHIPAL